MSILSLKQEHLQYNFLFSIGPMLASQNVLPDLCSVSAYPVWKSFDGIEAKESL